jgi:hypothetical protein
MGLTFDQSMSAAAATANNPKTKAAVFIFAGIKQAGNYAAINLYTAITILILSSPR